MERRIGWRAQVDLPAKSLVDGHWHECRIVDISPTGMVIERRPSLARRRTSQIGAMTVMVGDDRALPACTRTVWARGRLQAVRFVVMNDVDRLDIAEHLDRKQRLGESLH